MKHGTIHKSSSVCWTFIFPAWGTYQPKKYEHRFFVLAQTHSHQGTRIRALWWERTKREFPKEGRSSARAMLTARHALSPALHRHRHYRRHVGVGRLHLLHFLHLLVVELTGVKQAEVEHARGLQFQPILVVRVVDDNDLPRLA